MDSIFCIAIKGNERKCRNFARKKCPENLCYSHRKLAENVIEEPKKQIIEKFLGNEHACYNINCSIFPFYEICYKNKTKYSCARHLNHLTNPFLNK
jgi:hypothetical protein